MRFRPRLSLLAVLAVVPTSVSSACGGDPGGAVDPYPAPDFTLQDVNPSSPTYLDDVTRSDASGMVQVLYFASFT